MRPRTFRSTSPIRCSTSPRSPAKSCCGSISPLALSRSLASPRWQRLRPNGIDISVPVKLWLSLRVDFRGSRFRVFYNDKQLFEVEDSTFSNAGKIGLWTKADSVTLFDVITYGETK